MESDTNSTCSSTHSTDTTGGPTCKSPDISRHSESLRQRLPNGNPPHSPATGRNTSPPHPYANPTRRSSASPSHLPRHSPSSPYNPARSGSPPARNSSSPHPVSPVSVNGGVNLELLLQQHRAAVTAYTLALTKTSTTNLMATAMARKPHHTIESILGLNSQARHGGPERGGYHGQQYRESSGKFAFHKHLY